MKLIDKIMLDMINIWIKEMAAVAENADVSPSFLL